MSNWKFLDWYQSKMAKSKHYGPGPPSETFTNFDKDKEENDENLSKTKSYGESNGVSQTSKSKSYGASSEKFEATSIGMKQEVSKDKSSNRVETVNGEKYEEIVDSEDEANVRAAAEAIQAIQRSPGTK